VAARLQEGARLAQMTRHILGLFAGRPGARAFRRHLATEAVRPGAGLETLRAAVDRLSDAITTARQPGQPLSTVKAITREAPLASLFVAFLFGVAVARRR